MTSCNCSFETVVPAVAVSIDRIGVEGGEGWVGVPGVIDRALESNGGHLLETLRTSRPVMRLPGCPKQYGYPSECSLSPRTAVKCDFPEDFLEISQFKQNADCYEGMFHVSHEECGYQGVLSSLHVHQAGGGSFKTQQ